MEKRKKKLHPEIVMYPYICCALTEQSGVNSVGVSRYGEGVHIARVLLPLYAAVSLRHPNTDAIVRVG
jgi:hypothetical protein